MILETKLQVFFKNSPTLKIKLAAVGIDPDHVGFAADHVSAEQHLRLVIEKQNNPTSVIHHLQSIHFLCFFLFSVLPNFRESIFLARTSISALFFKTS